MSDNSDEIQRQPKYSAGKLLRGNGIWNTGKGNSGTAENGNANGHDASGASSSNSNGYNRLNGKPSTVIGVRYLLFSLLFVFVYHFYAVCEKYSHPSLARSELGKGVPICSPMILLNLVSGEYHVWKSVCFLWRVRLSSLFFNRKIAEFL